ncbi:DUF1330 domain-containing protein [Dyella flava]|uniref:DUF1330 domain-containing protein n=1 Tax=Dyella flava TaxID=1920170 RepID=A0ABS2JZ40_9GAMM|nr:DUF1330 domain-containing protein [Dyella flava]MBM7124134.1 DUF1330 domain-containing protein [Dyella flava]GLQ50035.1 hypothetical protein GCM10010872_14840 [Dyella flava]
MSAYIVVELTMKDVEALARYRASVGPTLKRFGGELLVGAAPWHLLHGRSAFETGTVLVFPNKDAALAWYDSPEYQALAPTRNNAFNSRFRILG